MTCLKRIFYLIFIVFLSKSCLCKSKNESNNKVSLKNEESSPRADSSRVSRGIIKGPEKPRTSNDRKRVTFADQILDDSIGAEPLDSNVTTKKSKKRVRNLSTNKRDKKSNPNFSAMVLPHIQLFGLIQLVFLYFYLH